VAYSAGRQDLFYPAKTWTISRLSGVLFAPLLPLPVVTQLCRPI
jgi:hypothetical protein